MKLGPFAQIAQEIDNVQTNIVGSEIGKPNTDAVINWRLENQHLTDEISNGLQQLDFGIGTMTVHQLPDGKRLLYFED